MKGFGLFQRIADQYFALLERLGQTVIATDVTGTIVRWSREAEALYGWSSEDVMGRAILDVTPADVSRDDAVEIMSALRAGEVWSGEFRVRGCKGNSFLVSVTDIPLLDERQNVVGIAGISAPSHGPTDLNALLTKFAAAANDLWRGQIALDLDATRDCHVPASEPHLMQLLSLILVRHFDAMDAGARVAIAARPAAATLFVEFGLPSRTPAVHLSIARQTASPRTSLLRDVLRPRPSTSFATRLVNAVGGTIVSTATPDQTETTHLILPVR